MKVKMILPALTEATSPFFRPIKYSLFPPLGLATLASHLDLDDEIDLQDEHVEHLRIDDEPDLVVIQVYITKFAEGLFEGMRGMGRLWQAAGTVQSVLKAGLLEKAAACGLRSLFVGFETLSEANLRASQKYQNLHKDYSAAIRRLHDNGVMVNGSFVFGMDHDDATVFDRTVEWAVANSIETATFHILTPYPGTALHQRVESENRLAHRQWDLYDTRHVVYKPARLTAEELENGYWHAYKNFYTWKNIWAGASHKETLAGRLRHVAYAGGWKKFEPLWDFIIRAQRATNMLPVLEGVLSEFGRRGAREAYTGIQQSSDQIADGVGVAG